MCLPSEILADRLLCPWQSRFFVPSQEGSSVTISPQYVPAECQHWQPVAVVHPQVQHLRLHRAQSSSLINTA